MLYIAIIAAQLGSLSSPTPQQLMNGRCDPPSCVPVIAPPPEPPPWRVETPKQLPGSEWAVGEPVSRLRGRVRRDVELKALGITTDREAGLLDAHTNRCIVTFYLKPGDRGVPIVWKVEGRTTDWTLLPDNEASACSASLIR